MCGIIGYVGKKEALPILINGLKRLEYRGYDSAGLSVLHNNQINTVKSVGKIRDLEEKIAHEGKEFKGNFGIAHTRWATHGAPSETNAHPHASMSGKIQLVHNGIIENYKELKDKLLAKNYKFKTETDTEIIANLIEEFYDGDLLIALQKALKLCKGAYTITLFHQDEPDRILAAKHGGPLVIGAGVDENIIASDVSAIIRHTRNVVYLEDGEIAEVRADNFRIIDFDNQEIDKDVKSVEWDIEQAQKGDYPHFLIKEIFEQDETVLNSMRGRTVSRNGKAKLGGLESVEDQLRKLNKIILVGCGTTYCASIVGRYMLEEYARITTVCDYGSEFRYRKPVLDVRTGMIAISQSGETADTLASIKEAQEKNILSLGVVNVVGSSIARATDAGVYNHVGPEISVASTKAFTSQITILALITVLLGRQRDMSYVVGKKIIDELEALPGKIREIFKIEKEIKKICEKYAWAENFAFVGRKYNMATAMEGAIKLKEISYIHAEGFAGGELKHHSIALVDEKFPSVFIIPQDSVYEKNISNLEEVKSRNGKVIAVASEGDTQVAKIADDVVYIPKTLEMFTPILAIIPLQFLAYHMAVLKGRDVDMPRNLAKSVTVE